MAFDQRRAVARSSAGPAARKSGRDAVVVPAMTRPAPRVSVVIPLHNYGHFLGECVQSALDQDGVDVDVLVIDDASTDDSLSVARAIAAADSRVSVVASERNRGMVATMNDGLWAAGGEYLVKLDADDLLTPGALARASALLDAHPSVGFVYGFPVAFRQSPPPAARTRVRSWTLWPGDDWFRIRCRKGHNCIFQPEVVMRASALHEAGPYKPEMGHAPDYEMWLRLSTIADVGRINGAHQGYYRIHPSSWQRTMDDFHLADLERRRDIFATAFRERAGGLPDAAQLERTARRAIALNAVDRACRAYDEGTADAEPIDGYVALALDLWPELTRHRRWRALERRRRIGAERAPVAPAGRAMRLQRDLGDRLRWRRWRWAGV
jgi:glycosyltransferase involved in cell wall biosynthesis